jgi:RNA polymerase sigma factor (sigma-70 family)
LAAVPSVGRAAQLGRPAAAIADAARTLYERFGGQVYGYCLHQLGSREEAEDAVQTTFLNAFRGLQRGIVPELESAWIFKIAHNVCLSRRRSSRRRGRVESPNNLEVLQEIVPARDAGNGELVRLQDALEHLPETQRRAILLREWQGLSYREIGAALELSQSAVETLIFRARRSLAVALEDTPVTERASGKRVRYSVDAGGLMAALKTLLGGTAIKAAVTVAAVSTAAVAVSDSRQHHLLRGRTLHPAPAPVAGVPPRSLAAEVPARSPQRHALGRTVGVHVARHPARSVRPAVRPTHSRPTAPRTIVASTPLVHAPAPPPVRTTHPSHPADPVQAAEAPAAAPDSAAPAPTLPPEHGQGHVKKNAGAPAAQRVQQPQPPAATENPPGAAQNGPPGKPDDPGNGNGNGRK